MSSASIATTVLGIATATTSSAPTSTSTGSADSGAGSTSRPLLFFVALGFGVVFTNLWIIVGVKYCFRYNQRARAGLLDESGEPIGMNNVQRPRRRREKKLMSMEDVNERFPLTKYKTWKTTRVNQGLSAAGGVTAPPSRAGSIRNVETVGRLSKDQPRDLSQSTVYETAGVSGSKEPRTSIYQQHEPATRTPKKSFDVSVSEKVGEDGSTIHRSDTADLVDDDDDDEHIQTSVAPELLEEPGDACAICIDNLDDEDEVRGLTCGHAFHAGCLDPWLTSRRACCPLCKADYYVPKPRPEGASEARRSHRHRDNGQPLPQPPNVWMGGRGGVPLRSRIMFGGSRFSVSPFDRPMEPAPNHRVGRQMPSFSMESEPRSIGESRIGRLFSRVPPPSMPTRWFGSRHAGVVQNEASATPAQLEAGQPSTTMNGIRL